MENNFYSHWQREKKKHNQDWDQQPDDNNKYHRSSDYKNHSVNFKANQDQNFYDSGNRENNPYNRQHEKQRQHNFQQQHQRQGWDNSDRINDRNWWDKTTDEVAGWFGDDDAQSRRDLDRIRGPHRGKGPRGYERSDERIREDVSDRFYDDPYIDASDINIRVEGKEVILEGTVENKEAKRRAEYLAESIRGVKDVENRLKINRDAQNSRGQSDY